MHVYIKRGIVFSWLAAVDTWITAETALSKLDLLTSEDTYCICARALPYYVNHVGIVSRFICYVDWCCYDRGAPSIWKRYVVQCSTANHGSTCNFKAVMS